MPAFDAIATDALATQTVSSGTGDAVAALAGVSVAVSVASITATGDIILNGDATLSGVTGSSAVAAITATGSAVAALGSVSATMIVAPVTATATSNDAVAMVTGVSVAASVATILAVGTRTAIEVDVTEGMVCRAVRAYIKSIAGDMSVQRTPVNRASMPKGAYVSFTPGLRRPLSTNRETRDDNSRTVSRPEQMSFQIDCYGQGSSELAEMLNVLYRDVYACDLFDSFGFSDAPLYAGDIQQAPYVNGEDQYENRYTFEIELQINSRVTVPLQSCNILGIDLVSVDATFPPTEE